MRRLVMVLGLLLLGCHQVAEPGYCLSQVDCPTGGTCFRDESSAQWHDFGYRCVCGGQLCSSVGDGGAGASGTDAVVPPDGGRDDGGPSSDGSDTGSGGAGGALGCGTCPSDKPVCSSGRCVECDDDTRCADPKRPFCRANACVACSSAGETACAAKSSATPVCDPGGACVECVTDSGCSMPTKPFCRAGSCVGCGAAGANACALSNPKASVCGTAGTCVECESSADCKVAAKPVCSPSHTCVACVQDAECAANTNFAHPGICMSHQDGRCATDAETVYVQNSPTCSAMALSGCTSTAPCCSAQDAAKMFTPTRRVMVIRGAVDRFSWAADVLNGGAVSVVGQDQAVVVGLMNSAIQLLAGDVYIRHVTVAGANGTNTTGIVAKSGSTLRLDGVTVTGNPGGGILLDGAAFDIERTTVTANGPGSFGLAGWGGILVQNPPVGGPSKLERMTITDNKDQGLTCSGPIEGTGVLATGNVSHNINATCMVTPCGAKSDTCGAP